MPFAKATATAIPRTRCLSSPVIPRAEQRSSTPRCRSLVGRLPLFRDRHDPSTAATAVGAPPLSRSRVVRDKLSRRLDHPGFCRVSRNQKTALGALLGACSALRKITILRTTLAAHVGFLRGAGKGGLAAVAKGQFQTGAELLLQAQGTQSLRATCPCQHVLLSR
jgi:hypothetical protein